METRHKMTAGELYVDESTGLTVQEQSQKMAEWLPEFIGGNTDTVGYLPELTIQRIEGLFGISADYDEAMRVLREALNRFDDTPTERDIFGLFLCGYPIEDIEELYGTMDEAMDEIHAILAEEVRLYRHQQRAEHETKDRMSHIEVPQLSTRRAAGHIALQQSPQATRHEEEIHIDWETDERPEAWQDRALCAQTDPEAFFPEKGGSTREAKRICQGCEVRDECLEHALATAERFGIWGGLSERERRRIVKGVV